MKNEKLEKILTVVFSITILAFVFSENFIILEKLKIKHILIIADVFLLGSILIKKFNNTKNKQELKNIIMGRFMFICYIHNFSINKFFF
ncbi:MAG: hypothetical protein ACLTKT_02275 [Clostridia bacterium]|nr:hypothetical protein [Clostridium sp.]MBS6252924.1 hypothetical protein [Clostridium sp.]